MGIDRHAMLSELFMKMDADNSGTVRLLTIAFNAIALDVFWAASFSPFPPRPSLKDYIQTMLVALPYGLSLNACVSKLFSWLN